ncbi:MAG: hypothetical protein AAGI68_17105, partial [Planctomycetota bacterium]
TAVYDRWGRATQTQTWSIGYDSDDEADSVTASQSLAYRYDALGRRIEEDFDGSSSLNENYR